MSFRPLSHLPDELLSRELDAVVTSSRASDVAVLAHVSEFDARRLFAPAGYPSMFRYCVGRLRMSEDVAFKRVRVARVARRFPGLFDALEDGRLNLSGVALLAPHLTRRNAAGLLAEAEGRTRQELQALLASRFPMAAASMAVPEPMPTGLSGPEAAVDALLADPHHSVGAWSGEQAPGPVPGASGGVNPCAGEGCAPVSGPPARRARLTAVAPGCFELVALLGQEAHDQLVASRDLLGHAVPSGELLEVLERAIALQFEHLRRRRCGAAGRPRNVPPPASSNPRRVPNAVRRAVWERDGGRCTFVAADGHRCESRDRLELDHVVPVAQGGQPTVENLRLLCRAHNRHAAERAFGRDAVRARIETARSRRAAERMRKEADRARTEARRAAMARQDEELGTALRNLGYRGQDLRRALALCADRADAPPEARLRHALGCMAPRARREPAAGDGAAA